MDRGNGHAGGGSGCVVLGGYVDGTGVQTSQASLQRCRGAGAGGAVGGVSNVHDLSVFHLVSWTGERDLAEVSGSLGSGSVGR